MVRLAKLGLIAKVDGHSEWFSQIMSMKKRSGMIKICEDPQPLNLVVKRELHYLPVVDDFVLLLNISRR